MEAEIIKLILEFRDEVNNQFDKIDREFEQVNRRLDQVNKNFELQNERFDRNEQLLARLIDLVDIVNKKLDKQSDALTIQKSDIELVFEKLTKDERDIAKLKAILLG